MHSPINGFSTWGVLLDPQHYPHAQLISDLRKQRGEVREVKRCRTVVAGAAVNSQGVLAGLGVPSGVEEELWNPS